MDCILSENVKLNHGFGPMESASLILTSLMFILRIRCEPVPQTVARINIRI